MKLHLEIVTPIKQIYKEEIDEIIVPTINGQITILPNHVGLLTKIEPGELIIRKNSSIQSLAITGGFIEVANNKITILADYAVRSEEIEAAKAEEARKRAEKLLQEKLEEKDFIQAEADLRRALLELKIVHKRRERREPLPETSQYN